MENPETLRIRLTLHYDGGAFFGWQLQPNHRTVQGELERAVSRLMNAPTRVIGSGRTDRGVHATGQVAAVDVPAHWTPKELRRGMNALLPDDVWVAAAELAAQRFHPRYDAVRRAYIYRVGTAPDAASPFHARWCWLLDRPRERRPLDRAAMALATTALIGDHSFLAFAKAGQEHRGDRCIVHDAHWVDWEPLGLEFRIVANRFLHHMVRYLVGTLVEIGLGRRPIDHMSGLLEPETALVTSPPAPPEGLFLTEVKYPADQPLAAAPPGAGEGDPPETA